MPTARPRHTLTETDDITVALADAARRWPEDRRSPARLILRLLREGHRAIRADQDVDVAVRRAEIAASAGVLTGCYPDDYLHQLREDWPA